MSHNPSVSQELYQTAQRELARCNARQNPVMHGLMSGPDGKQKTIELVLRYAITHQISISAAVGQLESTLDD